jgi:Tol biopolymer transport system component
MENVSGAPAWSPDQKRLAIGCENNAAICVLDVEQTLASCSAVTRTTAPVCVPSIWERLALPANFSDEWGFLGAISWSPDEAHMVISSGDEDNHKYSVQLLITADGSWETMFVDEYPLSVAWSPDGNHLAVDNNGIYLIDIERDGEAEFLTKGRAPAWTPDGVDIMFIKSSGISEPYVKEPEGIASINLASREWQWLYEPQDWDDHYFLPQNLFFGYYGGSGVTLSPDGKYLVFSVSYKNDSQILRLDLENGELTPLLKNQTWLVSSPAWGP